MRDTSRLTRLAKPLVLSVRVLALVELIDAFAFMGAAGWTSANPILTGLVAGGIVGVALTWVRRPRVVIAVGGLMVAAAPSVVYPLSILLGLASLVLLALAIGDGVARAAKPVEA